MHESGKKASPYLIVRFIESTSWTGPILAFFFIAAAHLTFINNGFIWLEHGDIEQGRALIPLSRWWLAFTQSYGFTAFYRPFVTLLHSIDASIWGGAAGFHLTSILLHCIAALLVPLLISAFVPLTRTERFVTALIFGLHPAGLLPAGEISFCSESLMALFVSLAVWAYAESRVSGKWPWFIALFATTGSACFSKETSFFYLPLFFGLWEFHCFVNRRSGHAGAKNAVRLLSTAFVAAAALGASFWLRSAAMPVSWAISAPQLTPVQGIGTRLLVLCWQLVNLLSPLPSRLSDVVPITGIFHAVPLFMIALTAITAVFAIRAGLRSQLTIILLLIATAILPALDIVPLPRFYSSHYAYLAVAPAAGGIILVMRHVRQLPDHLLRFGAQMLVSVWLVIAGLSTATMGNRFCSDLTLFAPEVAKDPRFSEAWFYIGNYYKNGHDFDVANSAYDDGLRPVPGVIRFFDPLEFLINKSSVAVQQNRLDAADSIMRIAQATSPAEMQPNIAFIRADIASRMGQYDTVIALLYGKAENLQRPETCRMLSAALVHRGRDREAVEMEQRELSLEQSR